MPFSHTAFLRLLTFLIGSLICSYGHISSFFHLLLYYPTASSGPLSSRQPHSPVVSHIIFNFPCEGLREPRNKVGILGLVLCMVFNSLCASALKESFLFHLFQQKKSAESKDKFWQVSDNLPELKLKTQNMLLLVSSMVLVCFRLRVKQSYSPKLSWKP